MTSRLIVLSLGWYVRQFCLINADPDRSQHLDFDPAAGSVLNRAFLVDTLAKKGVIDMARGFNRTWNR